MCTNRHHPTITGATDRIFERDENQRCITVFIFKFLGATDRIFERDENPGSIFADGIMFLRGAQLTGFLNGMKTLKLMIVLYLCSGRN